MDKKGAQGENVLWIIRIIGTIIVVGLLVFITNGTIEKSLDIEDFKFYSIAERFLYSRNCFIKVENDRAYPGHIILEKFTEENLQKCMAPTKQAIGAKITLSHNNDETVLYYNQEYYEDIEPLTFSEKYVLEKKRYLVLVNDEPANMLIEVAWRK